MKTAPVGQTTTYSDVIAVLGAFPEEVRLLLTQLQDKREEIVQRTSFTTGTLHGERVVVALTGIGKVNAATTTMLTLEHFRPRVLLFTGIAGGVNPAMMPGDIVIGTQVGYHDYGTLTSSGMQRGPTRDPVTQAENPLYFSCDTAWVHRALRASRKIAWEKVTTTGGARVPTIRKGVIVTGDVFVASDAATRELHENMHAEATEMEGAAVAQVSHQQQVPFLVIRSMSDNAGNNATHDVKTFYAVAARNSAALVMAIVELAHTEMKK
ncbi:MAG TPA: 5'-methylthioadenosine/adenosylhomocysteine nucleosidase [Chryseolinea sp.]|nr:5'-methylthioadenosine/adenosylhomocysteine nucleosidase [Chryseolinea sp.]